MDLHRLVNDVRRRVEHEITFEGTRKRTECVALLRRLFNSFSCILLVSFRLYCPPHLRSSTMSLLRADIHHLLILLTVPRRVLNHSSRSILLNYHTSSSIRPHRRYRRRIRITPSLLPPSYQFYHLHMLTCSMVHLELSFLRLERFSLLRTLRQYSKSAWTVPRRYCLTIWRRMYSTQVTTPASRRTKK